MSIPASPLEPNAARELASFAFPKTDLSSAPVPVNASSQHVHQSNSKELHGSDTTAQATMAFHSLDEWDEYSGRQQTPLKQNSFSGRMAERLEKFLVWCVDPRNALIVWLFVIMQSAVITFCMAKMGWIGATPEARVGMEFGAKKTLFLIVVLKILCLHPSRAIWLYQWAFCPEGDRPNFDEAFPFASVWPKLTWLILIVTHISFFAQYFWWASTYIWEEGQTPTWATLLPLVLGLPGLVVAILQKVLERKFFRMHPKSADYEDERKIAKVLQALPKEWRVAIRVARPGQAPLEFATVRCATASPAV